MKERALPSAASLPAPASSEHQEAPSPRPGAGVTVGAPEVGGRDPATGAFLVPPVCAAAGSLPGARSPGNSDVGSHRHWARHLPPAALSSLWADGLNKEGTSHRSSCLPRRDDATAQGAPLSAFLCSSLTLESSSRQYPRSHHTLAPYPDRL